MASASWLLAAPAMILAFSRGKVAAEIAPPKAQGAKTSAIDVEDGVGRDDRRAGLGGDRVQGGLVDVGDSQDRAGGVQLLGQIAADMTNALDGDVDALEVTVQGALDAQPHAPEHALGGDRRRIARGGPRGLPGRRRSGWSCGCFSRSAGETPTSSAVQY